MTPTIYRLNKTNYTQWREEGDIHCPICKIGRLRDMGRGERRCSVCDRWFEEVKEAVKE